MNVLPGSSDPALFWRLDDQRYSAAWDSGAGARKVGGRWSPIGTPVVYAALDPATAILEIAVHKGFEVLNGVPHTLTAAELKVPWSRVHVVQPPDVPNSLWLYPCAFSSAQQEFGGRLLGAHDFVALPSAVSRHSWNLIFDARRAAGKYILKYQEGLDLDPRLNPPKS